MARTIRRTSGNPHEVNALRPFETRRGGVKWEWVTLHPGDAEYSKLYWEIHGDCRSGVYGVPRWYRHEINSSKKTQEKKRLRQALDKGLLEELIFDARKNDAGYSWW